MPLFPEIAIIIEVKICKIFCIKTIKPVSYIFHCSFTITLFPTSISSKLLFFIKAFINIPQLQ